LPNQLKANPRFPHARFAFEQDRLRHGLIDTLFPGRTEQGELFSSAHTWSLDTDQLANGISVEALAREEAGTTVVSDEIESGGKEARRDFIDRNPPTGA